MAPNLNEGFQYMPLVGGVQSRSRAVAQSRINPKRADHAAL